MEKYIEAIKNMFSKEKNSKIKSQNLIFLVILLVAALIAINSIFSSDEKRSISTSSNNLQENSNKNQSTNYNDIETKLKETISKISGVSDVSVMITYSSESKKIPVYDIKEDITIEESSDDGCAKTTKKTTTEKNVAYEEQDGQKVAIVESNEMPEIIGAIIVANYGNNTSIQMKIKEAVASALNVPLYKVQVFER